jgi:tRNA pseudouridine32 synthase/23S rRNA pseudouridine746 synthase
MLLAHSKKMATALSQIFEKGTVHKSYQANVWGNVSNTPQTLNQPVQGKLAVSHIQLLAPLLTALKKFPPLLPQPQNPAISRVNITIETGRKHQIRTHLSLAGYPIIGDRLHGCTEQDAFFEIRPNLQLTAYQLKFLCPIEQIKRQFCLSESQLDLMGVV